MEKDTLVYYHRRKDTNEVFYVGIGNSERPYSKNGRSDFWFRIVDKADYDVEIVHTDLTWDEACELEIKYIKEFGRRDLGLGNLVNLTDGGDGGNLSPISKKKIGDKNRGKKRTNEFKKRRSKRYSGKGNPMFGKAGFLGKTHTSKTKEIQRQSNLNKIVSEETRKKIGDKNRGKKRTDEFKENISRVNRGENNSQSKLKKEDVLDIRTRYAKGGIIMKELAEKYGVSITIISSVINRKSWKHI
jgi:hypothetical protein